jgi:Uri superfamily endonuclease
MVVRGTYCICVYVEENVDIVVGALGLIHFSEGKYVYAGSGLNSLIPRVMRHIRTSRGSQSVTRWHIDYLLSSPLVSIRGIYIMDNGERLECVIAEEVSRHGEAVKGFGCSDCRCVSHLYKVNDCGFLEKIGMKRFPIDSPQLLG